MTAEQLDRARRLKLLAAQSDADDFESELRVTGQQAREQQQRTQAARDAWHAAWDKQYAHLKHLVK